MKKSNILSIGSVYTKGVNYTGGGVILLILAIDCLFFILCSRNDRHVWMWGGGLEAGVDNADKVENKNNNREKEAERTAKIVFYC
jgi:hypothetical protein